MENERQSTIEVTQRRQLAYSELLSYGTDPEFGRIVSTLHDASKRALEKAIRTATPKRRRHRCTQSK
jgi:hypothetical protein